MPLSSGSRSLIVDRRLVDRDGSGGREVPGRSPRRPHRPRSLASFLWIVLMPHGLTAQTRSPSSRRPRPGRRRGDRHSCSAGRRTLVEDLRCASRSARSRPEPGGPPQRRRRRSPEVAPVDAEPVDRDALVDAVAPRTTGRRWRRPSRSRPPALVLEDDLARLHVRGSSTHSPSWNRARAPVRSSTNASLPIRVRTGSALPSVDSWTASRRRPHQPATVDRPHRAAIRRHLHLRRGVDVERDRLAGERQQRRLRRRRGDDDQPVAAAAAGDGVRLGQWGDRHAWAKPQRRRIDQPCFCVRAVEEVRTTGPLGDGERRPLRRLRRAGRAPDRRSRRRAPPAPSAGSTPNHRVARVAEASIAGNPSERRTTTTAVRAAATTATITNHTPPWDGLRVHQVMLRAGADQTPAV